MKKLALIRGAEEAPHSVTGGTESGSGVVSMRTFWLKLQDVVSSSLRVGKEVDSTEVLARTFLKGRVGWVDWNSGAVEERM